MWSRPPPKDSTDLQGLGGVCFALSGHPGHHSWGPGRGSWGCHGTDSVLWQMFILCSMWVGTLEVVISGAVRAAALWGHGLPLKQGPDEDGDSPFSQKPRKKSCLSLWTKKKVRLMLLISSQSLEQRAHQVLLRAAAYSPAVCQGEEERCGFSYWSNRWLHEVCPGESLSGHHGPGIQFLKSRSAMLPCPNF